MNVRRHASAREFLDVVGPHLRARPVINQMALGIAATCLRESNRYGDGVRYYSVDREGEPCGAALQTPPWPVQIAGCTPEAAALLGRTFAADHELLAGVAGPDAMPEQFAHAYAAVSGATSAYEQGLGVFELHTVTAIGDSAGTLVTATVEHAPLVQAFIEAFQAEASPNDPPPGAGAGDRAVESGRAFLWLDAAGSPVCYAANTRTVEGWAAIGPVYTPPAARRLGYATTLVAALSRQFLAEGNAGCTLFTNLANPTSNAIYERIGYRRVGVAHRYAFTAGPSSEA